jgi:alpha-tubulin suppressor-like RCC1 family protein
MYASRENAIVFLDENNQIQILKIYSYFADWAIFDNNNIFKPQGLPENIKIKQINAGDEYLHVLLENDELYALGANNDGQLGIDSRSEPIKFFTKVYGIENIKQLSTNNLNSRDYYYNTIFNSCFIITLAKDGIYGWGANQQNQLGKYDNYDSTYYEEGIIFKEKIWSKKESFFKIFSLIHEIRLPMMKHKKI